jgi:DnaJ-like protein
MADEPDYYAELGVPAGADEAAIRLAYRRLARRYHPDIAGSGSVARMTSLNVAYAVLSDPNQRREYDARRKLRDPAGYAPPSASPPPSARPAPPSAQPRGGATHAGAGPLRLVASLAAPDASPIVALDFARAGLLVGVGLIDGRILLHDLQAGREVGVLAFGTLASAGVLQDLRLSPAGVYVVAWGFPLGTRVWRTADGVSLWHTATNGPSGAMDAALWDNPPFLRLAVPDAPLAVAGDDPFRWADEGRRGSAVFARPLTGPVDTAWAVPLRCDETRGGGLFREPADERWRVRHRALAADGRTLLTYATGGAVRERRGVALTLWDIQARSHSGIPQPRRIARIAEPEGGLEFPLAASADLAWVAASDFPVGLRLLSLTGGHKPRAVPAGAVRPEARVSLSPDGAYAAIAREDRLELWDTRDGRRAQEWQFAAEITALAFAGGAARPLLGVGLANGLAELWG